MPTPTATPSTTGATARSRAVVPDKAVTLDRLETEVGVLLRRIRRVMADRARATHPEMTAPGYLILQKLRTAGPLRSSELVTEFGIDKGAISRQVQQLVDLGLVDRTADPEDGRAQLISVSALGAERLSGTATDRRALLESRLAGWSDADLDGFVSALARYNASLGVPDQD